MTARSTLREHLEAIRDRNVWTGKEGVADCHCMVDVVDTHDHAVAALAILDAAQIQLPMMIDAGMGNVEFIDDALTPEGAAIYRAAKQHRLVPDPEAST